jgi:hypothetical protein
MRILEPMARSIPTGQAIGADQELEAGRLLTKRVRGAAERQCRCLVAGVHPLSVCASAWWL